MHAVRFRDFEDIGFYFHWVGNYYCADVILFVEGCRVVLFGEVWVLDKEHERSECDKADSL